MNQSLILTSNIDNCNFRILDQVYLLHIDNCVLRVDIRDNLFIAEINKGTVKKIQYYIFLLNPCMHIVFKSVFYFVFCSKSYICILNDKIKKNDILISRLFLYMTLSKGL